MNGVNVSLLDILVPWQKVEEYLNNNCSGLFTVNAMTTRSNKQVKHIELQDSSSGIKCKMFFMMNDHNMLVMEPMSFTNQFYIENANESTVEMFSELARTCSGTVSWSVDEDAYMIENGRQVNAEFYVMKAGAIKPKIVGDVDSSDGEDDEISYNYYIKDYLDENPALQQQMNVVGQQTGQVDAMNYIVVELIKARQAKEIPSRQLRDLLDQLYSFGATHPTGKQLHDLLISE